MLELWKNLFAISPFIPHGHCYLWKPGLVGLHIASDLPIALAYYSIPITLLYFVRKRQDLPYPWIFLLFSAFIVSCGTTHLMDIWTLWYPTYWLSGCLKAITAFVSVLTAIELVPLIPKVLALPSPALLEAANRELEQEIRERTKIEAALQEREQSLRQIYDSVSEVIWVVEQLEDGEFQTVSMNRAIETFGLSAEDWVGKRLDELWDSETAATIRARYYECLQQGKSISYEESLPFGGQIRWFLTTLTPLSDSDSRIRLLGASMDITDRKQAEAALRESEARFQAFMNASPTAAWMTDKNGLLLYFNQTYSRMFDLPSDLAGKINLTSIYPPEFAQDYLKNICKVLDTDRTLEAIELAPLEDGSIGEFLVYKFPLISSSGEVLVGGVAIDITERQAALRERKKAETALQQREQEFRALVENAPDIIMRLNRECRYLYINPTVEQQSGIPAATFIGKTINELGAPEQLVNLWQTAIQQVFETGCEQNIEYEIQAVAGLTYYASRLVPEFGSDGTVQSVLAIARDISELKIAQAALEKVRDELEIRVKERTALLATANKELRQEISDRKQAQAALQTSESRLKELLDNTAAFISSARIHPNRVWEYDYYSPNGEAIFGYKGEEFAADPSLWLSRIPAEDMEAIVLPAMEDLYAGHQITIEYRFHHKNGNVRWLSNTLLAKKIKSEDVWFATGIVIDITERKQAEKALQESEQRFATLAKTAPVGIYRNDIHGNCVYGNERCLEMAGLSLEELIGKGWATALHPDDRDRIFAAWYSFVQQGIPYSHEFRLQRRDGSIIWVWTQAIAETNLDGNTIGYIGTITDITERKQSEQLLREYNQNLENQVQQRTVALTQINAQLEQEIEERKQIEDRLRRSEAKLSAILENAGACIYIKDLDGTYTYVNHLTVELFGCSKAEIIGANDRKFFAEELVATYKENNERVTNSGLVHCFEEVGIDRHGELHHFISTKVPLKNSDGDVYAMCGISTEITELKRTEAALRQSEERMQALLRAIPDLMFRHRVDGTYLDVAGNDSALLVPREMLIGTKLQDSPIPEQIKADLLERFQVVVATGTLQIYEHDLEKPDGIHSYETRIVKSGTDEVVCLVRDITERKRSQAALQESEERYRTVITAMAEGIVLQDADGAIRTCNASAKRILGLSRKQMMGRTSLDPGWRAVREDGSPFPGEEHPAMVTLRTGKACSNVVMGVHKPDSSFTWISINTQPIFQSDKSLPKGVVCSFADITARKQAEEALRRSEARYRAILEDQTELIARFLPTGIITYVNEAFCQFFGVTQEEVVGYNYQPVVLEEDREYVAKCLSNIDRQNPVVTVENRVIARGQIRWMQWINRGIFDDDGQLVELQAVGRDISDRKLAEENLRRYEKIVAATTDAICLVDRNYTYQVVNQAYLTWHNRCQEEILGRTISEVLGEGLFEAQIKPRVERCLSGETVQYELWVKYPNAEEKFLSATYAPYVEADGTISGVVASLRNLTELKRMEVALQQSESTLRAFFNSSVMMMGIVELYEDDILLLSTNLATGQLLSTTPEALHNQFVSKSGVPRSLLDLWLSHYREAVKTQAPVRFEYVRETPTGEKCLSACVCPISIGSNGRPRLSYIIEDISDRKRAEEALRQSESTLRSFFDSGSMMMGIVELYDNDIRHISDNLLAAQFFGKTPEQTKNRFASEMGVLPAHIQQWSDRYREALHAQAAVRFEYLHETPTEQKWFSVSVCPIGIGPNGRPRLSYVIEDISDRKRAQEALRLSEARLQHLTASIPGTLYSFGYYPDGSTKFEYVSLGCKEMFEFEPEQILEDRNLLENQVSPDDRPRFEEAISYSLQNLQPLTAEWRNTAPSGKQRWVRVQAQLEDREDGSKVWHGVILDISDRKQAEAALQQALQAAQAASVAKSRFLSNMSHELRTPLNAILGFSQVMVHSSLLSSEHKEQLKIINRSGEHLLNLINDILSMAKIEAGQTKLNENCFNLYQLLDDLEQMLKLKTISKGLELIFERASDLPKYVQTDENKLRQILINLLGNSIKFTASGRVVLRVKKGRVSEKSRSLNLVPKTHLLFEVEDTGPGISPDEIENLFDPFVQTESGRKSMQGTGLGLPISRQFVQMMGGNITVSSQLGQGAIFRFNIFAIEVPEANEKISATTLQVIGLEPNQSVYRILVVEDVQENRQLLSQLLEPLGFELQEAVNGREAIALWSTWKPHLILMDMRMPVMDGYEATREIKIRQQQDAVAGENHSSPADLSLTKIIALTASAFDEDRSNIMAAGCDDFIHKPFRESILFEKIAQHLGVRYIYQDDLPSSLSQSATSRKLTSEDLNVMPSEWIAQFQQEVLCANDQLILQLIEQIPEKEASLAQALTDLVNNFRLDILFNLVQGSTNE